MTRLRTDIWVSAYMRTVELNGGFATLRRRGAAEAGAVFIVLDWLDGRLVLFAPAPSEDERRFLQIVSEDLPARLAREVARDPDCWIIDIEHRDGVHGLTLMKDAFL